LEWNVTKLPTPFAGHTARMRPEWIDENGHMNLAFYVVVFDGATDLLWDAIGLGQPYRQATGNGTFAAETHILYRAELLLGDEASVSTQILGADAKRLHLAHEMCRGPALIAQQEIMLLHVSLETRRVTPFPPDTLARVLAAAAAHAALSRPGWVGRRVAMPTAAPA